MDQIDTFTGYSHFPGSLIFQEFTFPGKPHFPGIHISREIIFSEKSHYPGGHTFLEITYPGKLYFKGKSNFPGNQISGKVTFPGKSYFPGSHEVPLVNPKVVIICQILIIGEGEGGKKRLVDLRRSSLMASPQVKIILFMGKRLIEGKLTENKHILHIFKFLL